MNERIIELAHKADFIIKKNNGAEWRWGYIDPELAEKLEKFAELIVKETMQVVANQLPSNQYLDVAHEVIEHFGVEE